MIYHGRSGHPVEVLGATVDERGILVRFRYDPGIGHPIDSELPPSGLRADGGLEEIEAAVGAAERRRRAPEPDSAGGA